MPNPENYQHVSAAPTLPKSTTPAPTFDVADLYKGPVTNVDPQPVGQSYPSFMFVPLLNFAVRKRCLLVGGPGRSKTASAILMDVLAAV
jgi:hypothetical protein